MDFGTMAFSGYQFEAIDSFPGSNPFLDSFDVTVQDPDVDKFLDSIDVNAHDAYVDSTFSDHSHPSTATFANPNQYQYPDPELYSATGGAQVPYPQPNPPHTDIYTPLNNATLQYNPSSTLPADARISPVYSSYPAITSMVYPQPQQWTPLNSSFPLYSETDLLQATSDFSFSPTLFASEGTINPSNLAPTPNMKKKRNHEQMNLEDKRVTQPVRISRPVRKVRKPTIVECTSSESESDDLFDTDGLFTPGDSSSSSETSSEHSDAALPASPNGGNSKQAKRRRLVYDPVTNTNVATALSKKQAEAPIKKGRPYVLTQTTERQLFNRNRRERYYRQKATEGERFREKLNGQTRASYYRRVDRQRKEKMMDGQRSRNSRARRTLSSGDQS